MSNNPNVELIENNSSSKYPYGMTLLGDKLIAARRDSNSKVESHSPNESWISTGTDGSKGPALALFGGKPCVAYRTGEDDSSSDAKIQMGTLTGSQWTMGEVSWDSQALPIVTDHPVSLVNIGGYLYMAYKISDGDKPGELESKRNKKSDHIVGIAWSNDLAKPWSSTDIDNPSVKKGKKTEPLVPHYGISHGDKWIITNRAPVITNALINGQDHLFLVFGIHGGKALWYGYRSTPVSGSGWTFGKCGAASDDLSPGVTNCGDKIVVAYINTDKAKKVYTTVFDIATTSWLNNIEFKDHENNVVVATKQVSLAYDGTSIFLSCVVDGNIHLYKVKKEAVIGRVLEPVANSSRAAQS